MIKWSLKSGYNQIWLLGVSFTHMPNSFKFSSKISGALENFKTTLNSDLKTEWSVALETKSLFAYFDKHQWIVSDCF